MRLQALVFLGAAAARGIFEHIYSLGDSISDNGNYYTISGGTTPGPEYFKGRFSNGPTWVEYLARTLEAKLRVLAFGKATSDSKQFAGCIQQAESLIFEYNQKEKTTPSLKDHTLVTLAFLGNDFFDPKASAAAVSKNLERCASTILSHTSIKHMLIPTSSAPELFPYFQQDPSQLPLLKQSAAELETSWKATLNHLKSANPKVTFYNLNFRDVMYSIKNGTSPFLTRPFDDTDTPCFTPGKPKCSRPDTHMFFDGLHPTTKTHMIIAKAAAAILPQQLKLRMLRHA